MNRRSATLLLASSAVCVLGGAEARGQTYPARPVRLVVGFSAGGPTDVIARVVAQNMAAELGQPVVVENRTGANALIATEAVARETPDGHTLMVSTLSHSVNAVLLPQARYDPLRDFAPVGLIAMLPLIAVTGRTRPSILCVPSWRRRRRSPGRSPTGPPATAARRTSPPRCSPACRGRR
jgi:tripartite-type tricarboxylate transporter receptor subunit TctC